MTDHNPLRIPIQQLDPDLPLPQRAHADDAGIDLYAREGLVLKPGGGRGVVPTGIALAIPPGYGGFVLPRSGLARKHGITLVNTPGLVDAGYRNEIGILLINTDPSDAFEVHRGDRIAQLVVQRVETIEWDVVETLDGHERGLDGWGSSGRA